MPVYAWVWRGGCAQYAWEILWILKAVIREKTYREP